MNSSLAGVASPEAWATTCDTLHLWTPIAGKVRIAPTPLINHWWNATLYVNSRGLVAPANPYRGRTFDIIFDFADHQLRIATSDGRVESFALKPMRVADFYAEFMQRLCSLGIDVHIWTMPGEIENAIPFDQDHEHAHYDLGPWSKRFSQGIGAGEPRVQRVPLALSRQSEPGAFLLGQLRSRGEPLLRPHRDPAEGGDAQRGGLGDGGSLLARGLKLRLLAGQQRLWPRGFLRLCGMPEPEGYGETRF